MMGSSPNLLLEPKIEETSEINQNSSNIIEENMELSKKVPRKKVKKLHPKIKKI